MYSSTFIFAKGEWDEEFYRLDEQIAAAARATPGYLGEESWQNPTTGLVSNVYYWESLGALQEPRAKSLGHASSEAKASEIRTSANIARVIKDLSGCNLVLLCGKKAQLLSAAIEACGMQVVKVPHPGHRGLNKAFSTYPKERRIYRWAKSALELSLHPTKPQVTCG